MRRYRKDAPNAGIGGTFHAEDGVRYANGVGVDLEQERRRLAAGLVFCLFWLPPLLLIKIFTGESIEDS